MINVLISAGRCLNPCRSRLARLLVDAARMKARADGHSGKDFRISLGFSISVLLPFILFASHGLFFVAIISTACAGAFALAVTQVTGRRPIPSPMTQGVTS